MCHMLLVVILSLFLQCYQNCLLFLPHVKSSFSEFNLILIVYLIFANTKLVLKGIWSVKVLKIRILFINNSLRKKMQWSIQKFKEVTFCAIYLIKLIGQLLYRRTEGDWLLCYRGQSHWLMNVAITAQKQCDVKLIALFLGYQMAANYFKIIIIKEFTVWAMFNSRFKTNTFDNFNEGRNKK